MNSIKWKITFGYWRTNVTNELGCPGRVNIGFIKECAFDALNNPKYLLQIIVDGQTHG